MKISRRRFVAQGSALGAVAAMGLRGFAQTSAAMSIREAGAVLTWGITDKYTWLNGEGSRVDGQPERPLPFDADMKPVAAFAAEVRALERRHGGPNRKAGTGGDAAA